MPIALLWAVVVGGGGTRYDCLGGESPSERSTLTYVSLASPRLDSGSHASRRDADAAEFELVEVAVVGREPGGSFCWRRAIYPGMLSFAEGVRCT